MPGQQTGGACRGGSGPGSASQWLVARNTEASAQWVTLTCPGRGTLRPPFTATAFNSFYLSALELAWYLLHRKAYLPRCPAYPTLPTSHAIEQGPPLSKGKNDQGTLPGRLRHPHLHTCVRTRFLHTSTHPAETQEKVALLRTRAPLEWVG